MHSGHSHDRHCHSWRRRRNSPPLRSARDSTARASRPRSMPGYAVLEQGGSSLDAVTRAVRILEDDPLFNAGGAPH